MGDEWQLVKLTVELALWPTHTPIYTQGCTLRAHTEIPSPLALEVCLRHLSQVDFISRPL